MALPELPGVAFLSSGWDPEVNAPCEFDDCRTTRLFRFTYDTYDIPLPSQEGLFLFAVLGAFRLCFQEA